MLHPTRHEVGNTVRFLPANLPQVADTLEAHQNTADSASDPGQRAQAHNALAQARWSHLASEWLAQPATQPQALQAEVRRYTARVAASLAQPVQRVGSPQARRSTPLNNRSAKDRVHLPGLRLFGLRTAHRPGRYQHPRHSRGIAHCPAHPSAYRRKALRQFDGPPDSRIFPPDVSDEPARRAECVHDETL